MITSNLKYNKAVLLSLWFAACARLLFGSLNIVALYIVVPLLFILCLRKDSSLLKNKYMIIYSVIMFISLLSCYIAVDISLALSSWKTMMGGWMVCFVLFSLIQIYPKSKNGIMITYVLLLATTIYYLWNTGELANTDITSSRLAESAVNANDIAYLLFFVSTSITIMFYEQGEKRKYKILLVYSAIIVLAIWCSLITASRQILLVVIPMILVGLLYNTTKFEFNSSSVIFTVIGAIIVYLAYRQIVAPMIESSYLGNRLEEDAKEDIRMLLMVEGFAVGKDHWFLGVGTGNFIRYSNFNAFSHCSYSEIFANSGIFALISYIYLLLYFVKRQYKFYIETQDSIFKFTFIFGLVWALYNFLYVFYTGPWLIGYFFLIAGYSERKYKEIIYGHDYFF